MSMLGQYYCIKGRLLEGHVHCSNATQFAVALNLHMLNSRVFQNDYSSGKTQQSLGRTTWRPQSSVELGEAFNLWWTCCIFEYPGSTINGLPPSVARDDITTVWPCLLADFEDGYPLSDDDYSVAALFDPELFCVVADISRDGAKSAVAKCCIMQES
ncbi:Fungal specific transcription factor domain [Ceratobasidium sp. AG-Ba]|nr:Fungal specific transcription factor domain [Ceratobasidium sp. AG-Ba]